MIGYDTHESFERWAQDKDFGEPLRWGQIEKSVLRRRVPVLENDSRVFDWIILAITAASVLFVLVPLFGAPVIGLLATLAARGSEGDTADTWLSVAQFFWIVAAAAGVAITVSWWVNKRESSLLGLGICLLVVVCAVPTYLLLDDLAQTDFSAEGPMTYVVVAAVLGIIGSVVSLLSKPATVLPFQGGRAGRMSVIKRKRYESARARTLEIMQQRGLTHLDAAQQQKMTQMKLGTWHTLDEDRSR